jgi:hypothetical protein
MCYKSLLRPWEVPEKALVTITIDGGARTVLPPAAAFSRFEVTVARQGGTEELEPVEAAGGSAELVLPPHRLFMYRMRV